MEEILVIMSDVKCGNCSNPYSISFREHALVKGQYTIEKNCKHCEIKENLTITPSEESLRFIRAWLTEYNKPCPVNKAHKGKTIEVVYSIADMVDNASTAPLGGYDNGTQIRTNIIFNTLAGESAKAKKTFFNNGLSHLETNDFSQYRILLANPVLKDMFVKNKKLEVIVSLRIGCSHCQSTTRLMKNAFFLHKVPFMKLYEAQKSYKDLGAVPDSTIGFYKTKYDEFTELYTALNFMRISPRLAFGGLMTSLVMGADPELMAQNGHFAASFLRKTREDFCDRDKCETLCGIKKSNCNLYANRFNHISAEIGTDGCSDVFEIRPAPSNSVIKLFNNITAIMEQLTNMTTKQNIDIFAGSYKNSHAIGGHIHFSVKNRNCQFWDIFPSETTKSNCIRANNLLSEIFENKSEREMRQRNYGQSEFRGQGTCHVEWRMPMSWLQTPFTCLSYLTIHKIAVLLAHENIAMPKTIGEITTCFAKNNLPIPEDCMFGLNIIIKTDILTKYTNKKNRITKAAIGKNWIKPKEWTLEDWLISPPMLLEKSNSYKEDINFLTKYSAGKELLEEIKNQHRGFEIGIVPIKDDMVFDAFIPCHKEETEEIIKQFEKNYGTVRVNETIKAKYSEEVCSPKLILFLGKKVREKDFIPAIIKVIPELFNIRQEYCSEIVQILRKQKLAVYEQLLKEEGGW